MSRELLPTEAEIENRLRQGLVAFPPLALAWEAARQGEAAVAPAGVLRLSWQQTAFRFVAECKRLSNPKTLREAVEQARRVVARSGLLPLVVVPYLGEPSLDVLDAAQVSGIDLCGNGVVTVPGELYVRRTGGANRFPAEGVIKNVYRNSSSVVARLFLARPAFDSVQDALDELARRGGRVSLGTVSKVCKTLADDLIVERTRRPSDKATRLRLLQPDKLLAQLTAQAAPPTVGRRVTGKLLGIETGDFRTQLRAWADETGNRVAETGASSVGAYAVMARDGPREFYCSDVAAVVGFLGERFRPTDRFAAVAFAETRDAEVYFDRRDDLTASPVQTYLELSGGDKRDRETADQVRAVILGAGTTAVRE